MSIVELTHYQFNKLKSLAHGDAFASVVIEPLEFEAMDSLVEHGLLRDATKSVEKQVSINRKFKAYALTETALRLMYDLDSTAVN